MTFSRFAKFIVPVAALGLLAACGGETASEDAPTVAAADEPAVLKERHDNFESIGDAFKAIRGQLEGGSPDFGVIAASASDINTRAQMIESHFPEGTGRDQGYDTEALPTIWEKPEEFSAAAKKLIEESAALAAMAGEPGANAAAIGEQVKAMGGACKNCHDTFRLDDD
jgi:cytochrome c556